MPLVQLANGPLSAAGPVHDVILDEETPENGVNGTTKINEFVMPIIPPNEEKVDPTHFTLLKVLGQGTGQN